MTTAQELMRAFPAIPWRTPITVTLTGPGVKGLACRFCIALNGMKGSDVDALFADEEAWRAHMDEAHQEVLHGPA